MIDINEFIEFVGRTFSDDGIYTKEEIIEEMHECLKCYSDKPTNMRKEVKNGKNSRN